MIISYFIASLLVIAMVAAAQEIWAMTTAAPSGNVSRELSWDPAALAAYRSTISYSDDLRKSF